MCPNFELLKAEFTNESKSYGLPCYGNERELELFVPMSHALYFTDFKEQFSVSEVLFLN